MLVGNTQPNVVVVVTPGVEITRRRLQGGGSGGGRGGGGPCEVTDDNYESLFAQPNQYGTRSLQSLAVQCMYVSTRACHTSPVCTLAVHVRRTRSLYTLIVHVLACSHVCIGRMKPSVSR